MSGKVSGLVFNLPQWVKGWPRAVLGALAELADEQGNVVYQKEPLYMEVLAARAGCVDRTARSAVNWLEEQGLLKVKRPRGKGNPNEYRIVMQKLARLVPTPFPTTKPERDSGFGGGKEERDSGFGSAKPDVGSGYDPAKEEGDSGFGGGIKEPYLRPVTRGMDEQRGESARARDTALASSSPNRLSKEYFARRPAGPVANHVHSPPEVRLAMSTISDDFSITAKMSEWAEEQAGEHGVSLDGLLVGKQFLNHFRHGKGKGTELEDWGARWEKWVFDEIGLIKAKAGRNGAKGEHTNALTSTGGSGWPSRSEREAAATEEYARLQKALADPGPD